MQTSLQKYVPARIALLALAACLIVWRLSVEHTALLAHAKDSLSFFQPTFSAMSVLEARTLKTPNRRTVTASGTRLEARQDRLLEQDAEKLLRIDSPDGTRRAAAMEVYLRHDVPLAAVRRASSPEEAHLWRSLRPGAPVSSATAGDALRLSSDWNLGWYRSLLLTAVYQRAADPRTAAVYQARARAEAGATIARIVVLLLPILLAMPVGIGLSIVAAVLWRKLPRLPSPLSGAPALALVECAVFWILLLMFAAPALRPFLPGLFHASRIWVSPCLELLVGAIGMIFLRWWLRVNGSVISLPSRRRLRVLLADVAWGTCGYVCILPWILAAALVSNLIIGKAGRSGTPDNPVITLMTHPHNTFQVVVIFVLISVLAPLFEERFFRGAIYPALRQKMPAWAAACLTGAIFGGIHPQVPLGFLPIFVFGAGVCLIYELRGSTAACVVAHSLNNTMVFVLLIAIART